MRNLKKVLGLVLCLAMMLSIMVVGAGAVFADQKDIDTKHQEAVDACSTLNIITGFENGKFMPNDNVTREQTAKMICVLLNGGKDPVLGAGSSSFTDVANNRWSCPYIESCVSQDIIVGVGNNKFAPAGKVTGSQLAKMLLVALGFSPDHQKYAGSAWEVNVNTDASAKGFYKDLEDINPSQPLTREHAAQMIWNALNAYEVEYKTVLATENGQLTSKTTVQDKVVGSTNDKITLLEDKYETESPTGILTSVTKEDGKDTYKITVNIKNAKQDDTYVNGPQTFSKVPANYIGLLGQDVKVLVKPENNSKDATVYGVYATSKNTVVSVLKDDIDNLDNNNNKFKVDGKEYKVADGLANAKAIPVYYTPSYSTGSADTTLGALADYYTVTLIDNNDDDKIDIGIATPFAVAQIDNLSSSKVTVSTVAGTTLAEKSFDLDSNEVNLYKDAAEDDYVVVVYKDYTVDDATAITKADIVSGAVAATKGDVTDVKVGGTWYSVANPSDTGDTIKLNDSYDFATVNGFVFNADKTKGSVSAENILYVEKCGALTGGIADGVQAKVWFADGTTKTVTVTTITAGPNETIKWGEGEEDKRGTLAVGEDYDVVKTSSDSANDEITNTNAASFIEKYKLFTYSEKNGEYTLEPVYGETKVGNETYDNMGSYDAYVSEASAVIEDGKTAAKTRFADDGVIFVNDKDGVKVISGKTVTNWKKTTTTGVYGLTDKSNGTQYVTVGLIEMNGKASSDVRTYGFITSDVSTTKIDGTKYLTFDMWDGSKQVEDVIIEFTSSLEKKLHKYAFVGFDWANEASKEADDNDLVVKYAATDAVAIDAFVTDDTISFSDTRSYDFADEYYVIGVDTKNGVGATGKLATAKDAVAPYTGKCANAVYFVDDTTVALADQKVEAVFVDVSGVMSKTDKADQEIYTGKTISELMKESIVEATKNDTNFKGIENYASLNVSAEKKGTKIVISGVAKDIAAEKNVPGFTATGKTMSETYKGNESYPNVKGSDKFAVVYVKDLDLLLLVGNKEATNAKTTVKGTDYTIDISGLTW